MRVRTAAALALAATGLGASTPALAGNVTLPRFPALSPDGSTVVFSWRGDLWRVDSDGGDAVRLTSHPANESRAVWSPDGDRIAFESNRDGFANIWTMAADGTDVRRVTNGDRGCSLSDWAELDGEEWILFSGSLEPDVYRDGRPFKVSPDGGPVWRVHDAHGTHPVASPDGERVLFARGGFYDGWERRHYRGAENQDVWIHEADGSFTRLTEWDGNDGKARWLDDDTVLYLSDRDDRTVDLYRRDLDRPETRATRLTRMDDRDIHDWDVSADGRTAIVMSWDTLYRLDLTERRPRLRALEITAPEDERDQRQLLDVSRRASDSALSPDGKTMAIVAYGEVFVRAVADDAPTRRVTHTHAREQDLAWSPDGLTLYFTSDRDGTESIYAATVRRTRDEIRSAFSDRTGIDVGLDDDDAKKASSEAKSDDGNDDDADASGDPVTGAWSGMIDTPAGPQPYTLNLELGADGLVAGSLDAGPVGGSITGTFDSATGRIRLVVEATDGLTYILNGTINGDELSGTGSVDGMEMPMTATRVGGGDADASDDGDEPADDEASGDETDADDPALDPKRWTDAIEFDVAPVVARLSNDRDANPSPDGRHLAFRGIRGAHHLMDLETGDIRPLLQSWDSGSALTWLPDGQHVAYATSDLDFNRDIFIAPIDGSWDPVNITRHPDNESNPTFSADGRLMAFVSERVNEEFDVYVVALDEDFDALRGQDLDAYWEQAKAAVKKRKPVDPTAAKKDDDDANADDADAAVPFTPETLQTAYRRLRRVTSLVGNERQPHILPAGDRIVFSASGPYSGLHAIGWNGQNRTSLGGGGSVTGLTLDGSKMTLVSGGQAVIASTSGSSRDTISIDAELELDLEQQSSQKFLEAARGLGEGYYHPTMNGVNWSRATQAYHELATAARTADEFNWVANRFVGELNGSHLSVRAPGDVSTPLRQSRGRLGVRTVPVDGGFEVVSIMEGGPADGGPMALQIGDVITSVDGNGFEPTDTLDGHLIGRVGEETILGLRRVLEDGGDPVDLELLITPTSYGAIRGLAYQAWVRANAAFVHERSDGRLGYSHMQGMNQPSLDVFERDLFAAVDGRDGLVLDVRNNGGGWTTDRVLSSIMVRSHSYTVPRGADWDEIGHYPQDRLFIQRYAMPMNLLCNEKSYSNAEIMSHAFKTLERGTLVGMPTHGSVISTGGFSLIDGTFVRLPFRGWFVDDGNPRDMELNGAVPDILVPQTPEAESAGIDEQLAAAVDDLLERLDD